MQTANVGVQEGYHDVEVPDHIDWRGAYGRRNTKDFGFPGARLKPRGTFGTYNPMPAPNATFRQASIKIPRKQPDARDLSHEFFSKRGSRLQSVPTNISETTPQGKSLKRASVSQPLQSNSIEDLRQSITNRKSGYFIHQRSPNLGYHRRRSTRRRVASETSCSSSCSPTVNLRDRHSRRRPRHRHSDCTPPDRCGDEYAQDLGRLIDAILVEHSSSLQGVIDNIKRSQPTLDHLRRMSGDLVYRCEKKGGCRSTPPNTCGSAPCLCSCFHTVCRPLCQPYCIPNQCQWQSACPYVSPKAAEKLNVGQPGQLKPNLNDHRSSLKEAVQTVPDLIDFVNSAADDFGMDLDRRPSARDDQIFQNAPFEDEPQKSLSLPSESADIEPQVNGADARIIKEDPWLQKTRTYLTELSEVRTQLMDELDAIAEDLGVQIDEGGGHKDDSANPRRATQLTNKHIDSASDTRDVGTKCTSTSTRYPVKSCRGSSVSKELQTFSRLPVHQVQNWWRAAQTELPAAIGAIASVLANVPIVDYVIPDDDNDNSDEQDVYVEYPEDVQRKVSFYEFEDDLVPEPQLEYAEDVLSEASPLRRYTDPILDLRDRIAIVEKRFKEESTQAGDQNSSDSFKDEAWSPRTDSDLHYQEEVNSQGENPQSQSSSTGGTTSSSSQAPVQIKETEEEQIFSSEL